MSRLRVLLWTGLVLGSPAGVSADPGAPLPSSETQSLQAFAAANTACHVWSDGCVVCTRQTVGAFACSTPGIACQPVALACRTQPPADGEHSTGMH